MEIKLIPLKELQQGQQFRYQGSDENYWHKVISTEDDTITYTDKNVPGMNYRTGTLVVLKEEPEIKEAV